VFDALNQLKITFPSFVYSHLFLYLGSTGDWTESASGLLQPILLSPEKMTKPHNATKSIWIGFTYQSLQLSTNINRLSHLMNV